MRRAAALAMSAGLACLPLAVTAEAPFGGAIGGSFELTDQTGTMRSEVNPDGHPQLLFFGYSECQGICSHALPTMAQLTDRLAEEGHPVTPVLIAIDPELDTVDRLATAAPEIHPDFVGLTGTPEELEAARAAFQVEIEKLFEDPAGRPVYAHGSFIYLLDAEGAVQTLLPPVLSVERMTEIALGYFEAPGS